MSVNPFAFGAGALAALLSVIGLVTYLVQRHRENREREKEEAALEYDRQHNEFSISLSDSITITINPTTSSTIHEEETHPVGMNSLWPDEESETPED